MNKIDIHLPIDSVNGLERKLTHTQLIISENLEMTQRAKAEYYKNGILISEVIDTDQSFTSDQKGQRKRMYEGISYGSGTENTMVDPKTGEEIIPGPSGYDPEMPMVTELTFWQNMPAVFFSAANLSKIAPDHVWRSGELLSDLVYNAIQFSMLKMVEREKV
jgi:hypothetical protein